MDASTCCAATTNKLTFVSATASSGAIQLRQNPEEFCHALQQTTFSTSRRGCGNRGPLPCRANRQEDFRQRQGAHCADRRRRNGQRRCRFVSGPAGRGTGGGERHLRWPP